MAQALPTNDLERIQGQLAAQTRAALGEYAACVATAMLGLDRDGAVEKACIQKLADTLAVLAAAADVVGRARAMREAGQAPDVLERNAGFGERIPFARFVAQGVPTGSEIRDLPLPTISGLGFDQALDALVRAIPELAQSQAEIRAVYRQAGFALVKSADLAITMQVQNLIAKRLRDGDSKPTAKEAIQALDEEFTPGYAEVVVRNATNRAYAAGRMKQARELSDVAGLEFMAIHDGDARAWHLAADGLVARVDDPVWIRLSPPLGHN